MEISRELALEIFGLKESFSQEELKKAYRRLSKITHPDSGGDENVFRLIGYCKETLENPNSNKSKNMHSNTNSQKTSTSTSNSTEKKRLYVSLPQLYDIHYDFMWKLDEFQDYIVKNNVAEIRSGISIYISPLFRKNITETMKYELNREMKQFLNSGFVQFTKTILIPERLKNYKKLRVHVEFMGETSYFIISCKKNNCFVKYLGDNHGWGSLYTPFKSIVDLNFQF